MTQAEALGFKATSVASMIITIIAGLSGVWALHTSGLKDARDFTVEKYLDSKEYTDLRVDPLEKRFDVFEEDIKKKINKLQGQ